MFKNRFDIDAVIHNVSNTYNGEKKKYNSIYIKSSSKQKFFDLVSPYIIGSMRYKLPSAYSETPQANINNKKLDFGASFVISVPKIKRFSKLYDIEVDETHNFFANNTLVHNCRRWQNIGGKIFVDAASNLTHQGGHVFTGNFLESLKNMVERAPAPPDTK